MHQSSDSQEGSTALVTQAAGSCSNPSADPAAGRGAAARSALCVLRLQPDNLLCPKATT